MWSRLPLGIVGRSLSIERLLVVVAALLIAGPAGAADDADGFKSLFNGKDLTGWEGNPKFWTVQDGAITGETTDENKTTGNTFLIWKDGTVDDFELRVEYKLRNHNSGIQYRSKNMGNFVVGGYQADMESGDQYSGILYEERGRGILALRGEKTEIGPDGKKKVIASLGDAKEIQNSVKKDDWNEYTIIARGNQLTHIINGRVTCEVTDSQPDKRVASGILALQLHAGPSMKVQFRNIRLRQLKLAAGDKKIALVAGVPSHPAGEHEHNAGVLLLKKCLDRVPGVLAVTYHNGWPKDPSAFDNVDAIVFYMDGGVKHPAIQDDHLLQLNKLARQGVGIACVHYGVEVPADHGGPEFLDWIGGYFEANWSVNPHWVAKFDKFPEHPVTRGVKPFEINDEWYYHMRFREGMDRVTPILTAIPPASTLERPDGPHSGNPTVRSKAGQPQHVAWVTERENGGRGFGFTGGHFHKNWGDDNFRKVVLNALVWVAHGDVPQDGVKSSVSAEELTQNLDPKPARR